MSGYLEKASCCLFQTGFMLHYSCETLRLKVILHHVHRWSGLPYYHISPEAMYLERTGYAVFQRLPRLRFTTVERNLPLSCSNFKNFSSPSSSVWEREKRTPSRE